MASIYKISRFPSVQDCNENAAGALEEKFVYQMPESKSQGIFIIKSNAYFML